jgi:hypothetical protein
MNSDSSVESMVQEIEAGNTQKIVFIGISGRWCDLFCVR